MDKNQLKSEKKKFKKEQQEQKKEAKRRARELAKQEDALDDDGNGLVTIGATLLIVALWLAVVVVIIKLDIGGFGSTVLSPLIKDVPVLNQILPEGNLGGSSGSYGGYSDLEEAVEQIRNLELELERFQTASNAKDEEIESLKAEVQRLKPFEEKQTEFDRIQKEFYEEVVYSEKGLGAEEYQKYYESMDPAMAEYIYRQVVVQLEESQEIQDYAATYSGMKPKAAAAIFDTMESDLQLVSRILKAMSAEARGSIMAQMDQEIAAKLTKIMDPES